MIPDFKHMLKSLDCSLESVITEYADSHPVKVMKSGLCGDRSGIFKAKTDTALWDISHEASKVPGSEDCIEYTAYFKLVKGFSQNANVGIRLNFAGWSAENYVLMPAASYNGNRFEARCMKYPPFLSNPEDIGPEVPTIINDVPRLNNHEGVSEIKLMTRDMSTPSIGFYAPGKKRGFWLLTHQDTWAGDSGIAIEESCDRRDAVITVSAPGVRPDFRYTIGDTKLPSTDRGADFKENDGIYMQMRLYSFECRDIQELLGYFVKIRKDLTGPVILHHQLPFSSAWEIQLDKYENGNWSEEYGYYSVGMRENPYQSWQIGWVGGMMNIYPLLVEGSTATKKRVFRNFDFVFPKGQTVSGFFHGIGDGEKWYGDNFFDMDNTRWHLIRKSSDALYFIMKQFLLLRKQDPSWEPKKSWEEGILRCIKAFTDLWDKRGQFGQFVDTETGDIIIGGSVCAGTAPAGLALAWQYFGERDYLRVAEESAKYFYDNYLSKGYTTGGPGEIVQCPDSESAFNLLESFIVLFETTRERHWLNKAEDAAKLCITWCVSYDFKFPPDSTFGKLGMHTAGAVYASVQNKHGAPGICTLSGDSLFKLYRATGNEAYLELLGEIAHNLPQYLSRKDRPIGGMPPGFMNERVNLSDWCEPIGEIFYGSCWCEVSNMMTYVEVPGIYVQTDTGFVFTFDHVDAWVSGNDHESLTLKISNPTGFRASVKIFSEKSTQMMEILGQNAFLNCLRVDIGPKSEVEYTLWK